MKRRRFIRNCTFGAAATLGSSLAGAPVLASGSGPESGERKPLRRSAGPSLFPIGVPRKQWAHFEAQGYSRPVCGVVYRLEDDVPHGMPLGGVATGSLDVDTDGTFGYCTLFNSGVPTRGPLRYGFLGVSSEGRAWILSSRALPGLENARQIHYWGHYHIVDIEYELEARSAWACVPGRPSFRAIRTPQTCPEPSLKSTSAISLPRPARRRWLSVFPGPRRPKHK